MSARPPGLGPCVLLCLTCVCVCVCACVCGGGDRVCVCVWWCLGGGRGGGWGGGVCSGALPRHLTRRAALGISAFFVRRPASRALSLRPGGPACHLCTPFHERAPPPLSPLTHTHPPLQAGERRVCRRLHCQRTAGAAAGRPSHAAAERVVRRQQVGCVVASLPHAAAPVGSKLGPSGLLLQPSSHHHHLTRTHSHTRTYHRRHPVPAALVCGLCIGVPGRKLLLPACAHAGPTTARRPQPRALLRPPASATPPRWGPWGRAGQGRAARCWVLVGLPDVPQPVSQARPASPAASLAARPGSDGACAANAPAPARDACSP